MAIPDLAAVQEYLGDTSWTDADVSGALAAELAAQAAVVRPAYFLDADAEGYRAYPADLGEALMRRVARNLAARAVPLSVAQGDAETAPAYVPRLDPEIRRLEAPYRRLVVG